MATQDDETLRTRTLTALARATFVFLQHVRNASDLARVLRPWMPLLLEVLRVYGVDALSSLVIYTMEASKDQPDEIGRVFGRLGPGAQEVVVTAAEQLREAGLAEGLAKGAAEERLRLLTRQIERRFGPLPASVYERLAQADEGQLERWADAVVVVDSLEALLQIK